MEIKINGTPKEIADLALELQNRLMLNLECDSHELAKQAMKGVRIIEAQSQKPDEVDFTAAQKTLELQNRQNKNIELDDVIKKQIQLLSEKSEICCHTNHGVPDSCKALASLTHALVSLYALTKANPVNIKKTKCTVTDEGFFVQSLN